jgi:hypothetical protein
VRRECDRHPARRIYFVLILLGSLLGSGLWTFAVAQDQPAQKSSTPSENAALERAPAVRTTASTEEEIEKLKNVVAGQEKRIQQLEQLLDEQKKVIDQALHLSASTRTNENGGSNPGPETEKVSNTQPALPAASEPIRQAQGDEASPLALRIGKVSVNPYGFLDFTSVIRDHNVGSGGGTNFGGIPFSNTVNGHLSEFRFTAQNSRLGVRFDAHHGGADVLGFIETDFAGNSPGNAPVTTNSNGIRMRLFWMDARKGKWEILGGQSWSLLTPNRKGVSPVPNDVFATLDIDTSNQVGLTWARDPQFRVIYHVNRTVNLGVSLEAAEQYGGGSAGAGEITLPAALESSYNSQINRGETTFSVPNLRPDLIAKIAFDPKVGNRDLHFEVAGLLSGFRFYNPQNQTKHGATGAGILAGLNYEAFKNFRLIANGFYSNGGGRWIFGLGPDLIINSDGKPSLVHAASTVSGFEYQASPRNTFDGYYGGAYLYRSVTIDLNGQPVGYGYTGSPSNHNRSLQQFTLGYTRTFWRDPNYGALQFLTQYSYLVRHPWFVPVGQPGAANLNSLFLSIRYVLPGAPPANK